MLWPDGRYPNSKTEYMLVHSNKSRRIYNAQSSVPSIKFEFI